MQMRPEYNEYMKNVLLIIAKKGYQDVELAGTQKGLEAAGFTVRLASTETGPCVGKFNGKENAQLALSDVNVTDYDRIGYIGGPGAHAFKDDPDALRIARETVKAEKPLGAICIAPTALAAAGVLAGKKATVWNEDGDQDEFLAQHGATYTGDAVTVDGLIVTANGPDAAAEFGRVFAAL